MSTSDKFKNKGQEISGKVKETIGDVTNDDQLKAEGLKDQALSKSKQAGENIKDGAQNIKDNLDR